MISNINRARRYIAKCDPAISGQGGHNTAFRLACILNHGFGLSEHDALTVLARWNSLCVPPWTESELIHKVRSAANTPPLHHLPRGWMVSDHARTTHCGSGESRYLPAPPPKPQFREDVLKRIVEKTSGITDVVAFISERSQVCVETQDSASVLRWLYPPGSGEKVLVFDSLKSQGQLWEADKSDVFNNDQLPTGDEGVWFLPQPVDGEFHPNPRSGKSSGRSEESVTAWRYAVLESDEAGADDWLRCLVQLPLTIACICESGKRSIHALVRVDATSKADWDARVGPIKPTLITLGADSKALTAVKLSRLPQAKRGERIQRLLYLNPDPSQVPILDLTARVTLKKVGGIAP